MSKILIVDDEKMIRERLYRLLELEGFEAFSAENGLIGLATFEKEKPDIVILDVKMPGMDGVEVLTKIKEASKETEVIMMTGHGGVETAIQSLRQGAFDYLEKPVDFDQLEISVKRALEKQEMRRKLDEHVEKLLLSSKKWQDTFDAIHDSVCIIGKDMRISQANQKTKDLFGNQDVVGSLCYKLFHGTNSPPDFCPVVLAFKTGNPADVEVCEEHLGGKWLHVSAYLVGDEKESSQKSVHVARDITERKRAEKERDLLQNQLFQAGKLASIGTLSAGIAHELNNPLTAVLGFAHILELDADKMETVKIEAGKIKNAALRMKKIINHLREFARESREEDLTELDIKEPIENSMILLAQQLKNRNIKVQVQFDEDIPQVWGSSHKLESVFQNFISNSRDAFDDVKDKREKRIEIIVVKTDGGVKIIHRDNACGMSSEVKEQIYTPFYTTKKVGKGTGLGLSISYGIIERHNGAISCESKVGEGTTFEIFLPDSKVVSKNKGTKDESCGSATKKESLSKRSILVLDDDPDVCDLLNELLGKDFQIKSFSDPKQGLKEIETTKYDLILTDYIMPGVSGLGILLFAKKVQPDTPVVLMSHLPSHDKDIENALSKGAKGALSKPFEDQEMFVKRLKTYLE